MKNQDQNKVVNLNQKSKSHFEKKETIFNDRDSMRNYFLNELSKVRLIRMNLKPILFFT
jgi:hypothetical protein